ncbi:uncharacterized protein A4U43_C02F22890 [Asparagus officinalis]|uniref:DEAD/DEAH-box helicase domain-containing protein n=1 Tax=Asparagus officinalis TaxID=4686 RepID=A0A5P1FL23_ASPOF|nr:uncharacterized protein A4U43_C02F22890 [Asparagus officinalis]
MASLYQTLSFPFFHKKPHSSSSSSSAAAAAAAASIYATTRNKDKVPLLLLQRSSSRGRLPLSAIATPNSVLSEEAFKGLGGLDSASSAPSLQLEEEDEEEEEVGTTGDDYLSDDEEEAEKDELAIPNLGLPQKLVDSLLKRGIARLFPIQRAVLVPALEGRDLIARAKTGTGKTLAFGIPILKRLTEEDEGQCTVSGDAHFSLTTACLLRLGGLAVFLGFLF